MDKVEAFFDLVKSEMTMTIATADENSVTMRAVSPVYYQGGILIFTAPGSTKYRQLKANPNCCAALGSFFANCRAALLGPTMLPENEALRDAYSEKFPDAFAEGVDFGGVGADFILLRPYRLTGWTYENDTPVPGGIPTIPFEVEL